jgi:putative hydrolase of the HAD superfamily
VSAVDAVICDLDDTLIEEESAAMRSLAATVATLPGHRTDPDDPDRVLAAIREVWWAGPEVEVCRRLGIASWEGLWATCAGGHPSLDALAAWLPTYRRAAWSRVAERFGVPDADADALAEEYVARQRRAHRLMDGVDAALDGLGATGKGLALLTNGPPDIQRHKVAVTGLEGRFAPVAISGELGMGKPEPAVYLHVTAALGVDPARTVMVGDSWERDVAGARAAGLGAVWISAGRPLPDGADAVPGGVDSVTVVPSFVEVPDALVAQ